MRMATLMSTMLLMVIVNDETRRAIADVPMSALDCRFNRSTQHPLTYSKILTCNPFLRIDQLRRNLEEDQLAEIAPGSCTVETGG